MHHHPGELTEHAGSVGGVPSPSRACEQVGVELGRCDVQPEGPRADLVGGLVDVEHLGVAQALAQRLEKARCLEAAVGLGHERGDKAGRDLHPCELGQRLDGPLHRQVLAVQQVEGGGAQARPEGGRGARLGGELPAGEPPAATAPADGPVLDDDERRGREVEDLARLVALLARGGEVVPARAAALRLVHDDLVGVLALGEVGPRRPGLLAATALLRLFRRPLLRPALGAGLGRSGGLAR